ncbi:translocation/assembly module TamB domain-containing protein [Providencia alcalifaciens]
MKWMKWLKWIAITILLLLVLVVGALYWVLGTKSGLHFALNSATRFVPELTIASIDGDINDLTLSGVKYQMPGVDVDAKKIHLALRLKCLTSREVCIDDLSTESVMVNVDTSQFPPSEETPPSESLTELNAPLTIRLAQLALVDTHVNVDGTVIDLGKFATGITWQKRAIEITPTDIINLAISLPPSEPTEAPKPVEPVVPEGEQPSLGDQLKTLFSKPLLAELPEIILPVDLNVEGINASNFQLKGDTEITINSLNLKLENAGQNVLLKQLKVDAPQGNVAVSGSISLQEKWPVALSVIGESRLEDLNGQKVDLTLKGGLMDELMLALNLNGPITATLEAQTDLAQADFPIELTLESKKLTWPLVGESQYKLDDTRLRLNGRPSSYDLSLRSAITGQDLPPSKLLLDAKGNEEKIDLTRLRLSALQGNADLSGVADWSKAISWNMVLTLSDINTAKQYPEWPAKVEGKIATRGSLYGGSWQLEIPEITLDGNVKQHILKARGQAKGNAAGQWNIPDFNLLLGKNSVNVKGSLADKWNLDAKINAPALNGLVPGLGGVIIGDLKLRGDLQAPQALADLTARGVRWQDLTVEATTVKGNVATGDQIKGDLSVVVRGLRQADLAISNLTLDAKGTEKQHTLKLNVTGKPVSGQLALVGGFDRQTEVWKGNLSNTLFDTEVGEWRLNQAMSLNYNNTTQEVVIGSHCWVNPNARVCVPKPIKAGKSGSADIVLERFDLAMIKPFMPSDTRVNGVFTGRASAIWKADGSLPQVKVDLSGDGVKVVQFVDGARLPIAFDTLTLNAGIKNGRADLNWLLKIADNGQFKGNVQISDLERKRLLSGNIEINAITLGLIKPLLGEKDIANGNLNANLRVGGSAHNPLMNGNVTLSGLEVKSGLIPFDIQNSQLAINFNGTSSVMTGQIKTPDGFLNIDGNADWGNINAWRATVMAKGTNLRVAMPPMIQIDVQPDLVLEASPNLLTLNGSVSIPWARITVQELPESAVSASSDVVMLDKDLKPINPKTASIPIQTNLNINIGDDVRLDTFGLKARLTGLLKVTQDKQGLSLNGQVDIPSGRFRAYGQDLMVSKGQILFSGPADQPFLNLEAIRNPENTADGVIAGVKVTGLADKPKVEIFSDPAKTQQEALSYLLRGEGLDSGDANGSQMASMMIGLGVAQSGQLIGKIGETFGVSDLAVDTQGVGDNSKVVVSGKITNDLQVKYGVGISDSLATLTLRYRVMPQVYLEAISGVNQALDLLYQFEF